MSTVEDMSNEEEMCIMGTLGTSVVLFRDDPQRATRPHLTYKQLCEHLISMGKARHIRPELSVTTAWDGYRPHS
jgi:hypothetical protein